MRLTKRAYRILVVRTAPRSEDSSDADLTAKARIRNAAISCFAEEGFGASFRTISARAGVSPGLINHHFGTKGALRADCDAEVLRQYTETKLAAVAKPAASLIGNLTAPGFKADVLVYLLRAVLAGGQAATDFLEKVIDDVRVVMAESVRSGLVRPSRDEEARLRYLTYQSMGALLVQFLTTPHRTPDEFVASVQASQYDQILPTLELFTEGFLTDHSMLDTYLSYTHHDEGPTHAS